MELNVQLNIFLLTEAGSADLKSEWDVCGPQRFRCFGKTTFYMAPSMAQLHQGEDAN